MPRPLRASSTIAVQQSAVHGLGVFARRDLPAGTRVGFYTGRRYGEDEIDPAEWDNALTYLFGLSDGSVIDGADGGNATRHLNHACEPNCEAVEYHDRAGQLKLRIATTRSVAAGDELFIDYALVIGGDDDPQNYPCSCGAASCRGTMAGPAEAA